VALERQSIEKKDFPVGRRGYEPDAVDAHLKVLADEIDELKRSSRRRGETLASSASEQVRSIVEAAETSAADIQRQAEEEAQEIRAEATSEAQTTREQATGQAREYVSKVSESTAVMLQRLDAMESELGALVESLRTGSNRLGADLQLLEGNLAEVSAALAPRPQFELEPAVVELEVDQVELELVDEPDPASEVLIEAGKSADEPVAAAAAPKAAAGASPAGSDDTEGARLIALNMALNGTPREETDRYLAENFELADRGGLLDEVYTSVEG
jgi:DivIVA domain-containing protein